MAWRLHQRRIWGCSSSSISSGLCSQPESHLFGGLIHRLVSSQTLSGFWKRSPGLNFQSIPRSIRSEDHYFNQQPAVNYFWAVRISCSRSFSHLGSRYIIWVFHSLLGKPRFYYFSPFYAPFPCLLIKCLRAFYWCPCVCVLIFVAVFFI